MRERVIGDAGIDSQLVEQLLARGRVVVPDSLEARAARSESPNAAFPGAKLVGH